MPSPDKDEDLYSRETAPLIAQFIVHTHDTTVRCEYSNGIQYLLQKGLKVFGESGREAAIKEVKQLLQRTCFVPLSVKELTPEERRKAMEAILFLTEKRDGSKKGRLVYNGKPSREWLREDTASPTAILEGLLLTAVIDMKERRDIMTSDIPNAFIQTEMPKVKKGEQRVTMKITGVLVDMIVQLNPTTYGGFVVFEKGRKVLYVQVMRAIYGMLVSSLLWYKKFRRELEEYGFEFNPYDPCVANKMVNGKQHTIRFHVDDLMSTHVDPKVNDEFLKWLNSKYGKYGEVKGLRGKYHDFLGIHFDFRTPGILKLDMIQYVRNMLDDFPIKFTKDDIAMTPAENNLLESGGKLLAKSRKEQFHSTVAKGLFVTKRARPDIHPVISILCTRVKESTESDWAKLVRMMKYLHSTWWFTLNITAEDITIIKWMVDASFAVHPDYKSHTGATMQFGGASSMGAVATVSRKQKLNTKSSTEAELVGADDISSLILWTQLFMDAQGYPIAKNILYQDNKSAILLEQNGKQSSSKRTRHLNIRYFFLTDQYERGNISIEYCPTDEMVGDYMTKPLQGSKFTKFRRAIMGEQPTQPMIKANGSHHQYGIIRTTRDQNERQHAKQESNGQVAQD